MTQAVPFSMDANGTSPAIMKTSSVIPFYCGTSFVAQVVFIDPGARGGVAFTNAIRVRFGDNSNLSPILDPVVPATRGASVEVSGLGATPNGRIVVEGGARPVSTSMGRDRRFRITVPLQGNRSNRLHIREDFGEGRFSPPATADVIQDSKPPELFIDFPENNALSFTQLTNVSGRVGDLLTGALGLKVWVNNKPAVVRRNSGTNGTFDISGIQLNSGNVPTTIEAVAEDAVGNRSAPVRITVTYRAPSGALMEMVSGNDQRARIRTELGAPLVVRIKRQNGTPFPNKLVTFIVTRSDGRLAATKNATSGTLMLQVPTDAQGMAQAFWTLGMDAGCGNNRVRVTSASIDGTLAFCASADPAPPAQINVGSGGEQIGKVLGQARDPLEVFVTDGCNGVADVPVTFTVSEGRGALSAGSTRNAPQVTVRTGPTGHASATLTLGAIEGNNVVEATFPANPGIPVAFTVFAQQDDQNATSYTGVVLDNSQQPIAGADCTLIIGSGMPIRVKSDRKGQFTFANLAMTGLGELHVEGATATHVGNLPINPAELRFPALEFEVFVEKDIENTLPMPVLLPRTFPRNDKVFDGTQDIELTVDGIEGLKMVVKRDTVVTYQGRRWGRGNPIRLSLNQVNADDIPMPMPNGEAPAFAWTMQPGGAEFSIPVEITYPNMAGLPAGAITCFMSFNHDTHQFDIVATGRISDDGSVAVTDPGSGLRVSGWGCQGPNRPPSGECETCKVSLRSSKRRLCIGEEAVVTASASPSSGRFVWSMNRSELEVVSSAGNQLRIRARTNTPEGSPVLVNVAYDPPGPGVSCKADIDIAVAGVAFDDSVVWRTSPELANGRTRKCYAVPWQRAQRLDLVTLLKAPVAVDDLYWWRGIFGKGSLPSTRFIDMGTTAPDVNHPDVIVHEVGVSTSLLPGIGCADWLYIVIYPPTLPSQFSTFYARERGDMGWIRSLPLPYSTIRTRLRVPLDPEPSDCSNWQSPDWFGSLVVGILHPGASYNIRSELLPGNHGHQATYGRSSNGVAPILTGGLAAGTSDRAHYSLSAQHFDLDVKTFFWAAQLDGNPISPRLSGTVFGGISGELLRFGPHLRQYLAVRPAAANVTIPRDTCPPDQGK